MDPAWGLPSAWTVWNRAVRFRPEKSILRDYNIIGGVFLGLAVQLHHRGEGFFGTTMLRKVF